jgi:hypothetical protein
LASRATASPVSAEDVAATSEEPPPQALKASRVSIDRLPRAVRAAQVEKGGFTSISSPFNVKNTKGDSGQNGV